MSSKTNKAGLCGAVILLVSACTISSSAQTTNYVSLPGKTDSTLELREERVEKKSMLATVGTTPPARPNEASANPRVEASDPLRVHAATNLAGMADEERGANSKSGSPNPQTTATDGWQFQLTPYLWIPTISGRAGIGNLVTDTSASVGDSDVELNFGLMATFEARKDRFIILTDLQYSDLATERDNAGPFFSSTRSSFKTFVLDPEIGYRILDNGNGATLDVLGGVRYWHLNANLAFRAGILPAVEVSRSRSWIDGIVGLRGKAALSQRFFVTGKADLGGGGSEFTYQLFGGVGVNLGSRFALIGGYRDLNVNYDKDGFLFDMSLHGPIFGIGIKF